MKNIALAVYDFDKTLYPKDSAYEFYWWLCKKKISYLRYLPGILWGTFLYLLKINNVNRLKERFFTFLDKMDPSILQKYIRLYWREKRASLFKWVKKEIEKNKEDGLTLVCISASPEFFLKDEVLKYLHFDYFLGTRFEENENKILNHMIGDNCSGKEKVNRLNNWAKENDLDYKVKIFYSDSLKDLPLFNISEKQYSVYKGVLYDGLPKRK